MDEKIEREGQSPIEEGDEESIVTLINENGEEINFVEIAGIALDDNFYLILQPEEPMEGIGEDEALVFKVTENEDGEDEFDVEVDDNIIDQVFKEYYKLLEEAGE